MKYTLKNRPNNVHFQEWLRLNAEQVAEIYDKWFEGFEKQEQNRLEDAEKKLDVSADVLPFKGYERGFLAGYVKAKKEILGE